MTTSPAFTTNLSSITRTSTATPAQQAATAAATPASGGMDKDAFLKLLKDDLAMTQPVQDIEPVPVDVGLTD